MSWFGYPEEKQLNLVGAWASRVGLGLEMLTKWSTEGSGVGCRIYKKTKKGSGFDLGLGGFGVIAVFSSKVCSWLLLRNVILDVAGVRFVCLGLHYAWIQRFMFCSPEAEL